MIKNLVIIMFLTLNSCTGVMAQEVSSERTSSATISAVIEPSFNVLILQEYNDEELSKSYKIRGNIDESNVEIIIDTTSSESLNYSIKINQKF